MSLHVVYIHSGLKFFMEAPNYQLHNSLIGLYV